MIKLFNVITATDLLILTKKGKTISKRRVFFFKCQIIFFRSFSRDAPTRRSMSEKRKQSSEVYSKVKINKVNDKTKNNSNPKGKF